MTCSFSSGEEIVSDGEKNESIERYEHVVECVAHLIVFECGSSHSAEKHKFTPKNNNANLEKYCRGSAEVMQHCRSMEITAALPLSEAVQR